MVSNAATVPKKTATIPDNKVDKATIVPAAAGRPEARGGVAGLSQCVLIDIFEVIETGNHNTLS